MQVADPSCTFIFAPLALLMFTVTVYSVDCASPVNTAVKSPTGLIIGVVVPVSEGEIATE